MSRAQPKSLSPRAPRSFWSTFGPELVQAMPLGIDRNRLKVHHGAISVEGVFAESPGLSQEVGHLGYRGWRPYLPEIFLLGVSTELGDFGEVWGA
jgi:hypothetical protein